MLWRELVQGVCSDGTFAAPASETALADVEAALSVRVPAELRALWQEANGVGDRYGEWIWSAQSVIERNLELRSYAEQNDLYMTFESLLCFAEEGNGDLFFFPIQADGRINRPNVFAWDHETDNRVWVAANLSRFVENYHRGKKCPK